jgi:6,7-dimethyl-8-ribityllumazine synthase
MKITKKKPAPIKLKAKLLILEANYYEGICAELRNGAVAAIKASGASYDHVTVPGALELPGAIALAAKAKKYDAYVALGCVLRGETIHFDIVSNESARGIMNLTLDGHVIGNGVITAENEAQAWARARAGELDVGGHAAQAALAMIALKRSMKKAKSA